MMKTWDDIVPRILQGDTEVINNLYREYRLPFIQWVRQQYGVPEDIAIELFQVAMVILYDNVMSGKLTELSSNPSTYLFQIGRNKALEYHRKQRRWATGELNDTVLEYLTQEVGDDKDAVEEEYLLVDEGMQQLGEPCRSLIYGFYVKKMSMEALSVQLDYKNADTVKNMKYKCLQRLRKICQDLKDEKREG